MKKLKNQILNSKYFTWFRKSFLTKILSDIESEKDSYCCNIETYHKLFICWKDLKEVEENMNSENLRTLVNYNCTRVWFDTRLNRINFLKECLKNLK